MTQEVQAKCQHLNLDQKRLVCQFLIRHKTDLESGTISLSFVRGRLESEFRLFLSLSRLRYWSHRCGINPKLRCTNAGPVYYGRPPRILIDAVRALLQSSQSLPASLVEQYDKSLSHLRTSPDRNPPRGN